MKVSRCNINTCSLQYFVAQVMTTPALSVKESALWGCRNAATAAFGIDAELFDVLVAVLVQVTLWMLAETYLPPSGLIRLLCLPLARLVPLVTVWIIIDAILEWRKHFANRPEKWESDCPSHVRRPSAAVAVDTNLATRRQMFKRFATVDADAPLDDVPGSQALLGKERASNLPALWDHLRMPLTAFIWLKLFIYVPLVFHFVFGSLPWTRPGRGTLGLVRYIAGSWLAARGWLRMPNVDYAIAFYDLLCNTGLAMFITPESIGADFETQTQPRCVTFRMANAARIVPPDAPGSMASAQVSELYAEVDVDNGRLISATFDGKALTHPDAFACLWFNALTYSHVQIHGFANFGVNSTCRNSYIRRMSCISIGYNYFGECVSGHVLPIWYAREVFALEGNQECEPRHQHLVAFVIPRIKCRKARICSLRRPLSFVWRLDGACHRGRGSAYQFRSRDYANPSA